MTVFDGISGGNAVLYDGGRELKVSPELLRGCSPGDVVFFENGRFFTDKAATRKRREEILMLQNSLWED